MQRAVETSGEQPVESLSRAIQAGEVQLAWGNPTDWKARWREEALRRHLDRPVDERLRAALSLVVRRSDREHRAT